MEYNGGAVVAMAGKNCVAIACDQRLGMQALTVSTEFPKVFRVTDTTYIGLVGLATDVLTLNELFRFKANMYKLQEDKEISCHTFANLVSSTLYSKRFGPYYVEPIIAGLDKKNNPYICGMDLIGCMSTPPDFAVSGPASANLFGMCESLYIPDQEPEDLFETVSQALVSAVDRDALSGWGATVHIITPGKVTVRQLKARQD